ncbi:putative Golgi apparatus membrane protein-like protein [Sesbania bispinosa]|nr:putative Golgi apparatus membrane protein-like protein [Sesbania bispinosa]
MQNGFRFTSTRWVGYIQRNSTLAHGFPGRKGVVTNKLDHEAYVFWTRGLPYPLLGSRIFHMSTLGQPHVPIAR